MPEPVRDQPPEPETRAFYADLALRHSSDGVVVTDAQRRTLWINEAFCALTGYAADELRGHEPGALLRGPATDPATIRRIDEACRHRREYRCEILFHTSAGTPFWVDLRITPVHDRDGRHTHYVSTLRDISERRTLEDQNEEMRQSESMRQAERQLLAQTSEWLYSARSCGELMMVVRKAMHTLIPEADGALYTYAQGRDALELSASWGSNPDFSERIAPDDCWALRRGRAYSYGLKAIEFACDHVRTAGVPCFCLPIIAHGETIGLLHFSFDGFEDGGVLRPMRERVLRNRWELALICAEQISLAIANVRLRQELHDQSVRDPLTGLWNRRWFMDAAEKALDRARDGGAALSLIAFDVDHFKTFNDRHGHDAGDLVLRAVSELLQAHFTGVMEPCRLGGEEFLVLCRATAAETARTQAEAFAAALETLVMSHGGTELPPVTVSAGVASFPDHGQTLTALIKASDRALYAAKEAGRNRVIMAERALPGVHAGAGGNMRGSGWGERVAQAG